MSIRRGLTKLPVARLPGRPGNHLDNQCFVGNTDGLIFQKWLEAPG